VAPSVTVSGCAWAWCRAWILVCPDVSDHSIGYCGSFIAQFSLYSGRSAQNGVPRQAVALLKQSNVAGNMAVHFDWGEYALWHLGPQIKVSIDGRRETVYSHGPYAENLLFTTGLGDWDGILRKSETHLALVSKEFPVFNLMKLKPGWTLVYEDPMCRIFVRQDSALEDKVRLIKEPDISHHGAGLCFP
jgi:hypothetical protein